MKELNRFRKFLFENQTTEESLNELNPRYSAHVLRHNRALRSPKTKLRHLDNKLWDTLEAYIKELIKKGELATWDDYYPIFDRLVKLAHDTIDAQVGNRINEGFFSSKEEKLHKVLKAYVQKLDKHGELTKRDDIRRAKSKLEDDIETIMYFQIKTKNKS